VKYYAVKISCIVVKSLIINADNLLLQQRLRCSKDSLKAANRLKNS